MWHKVKMYGLDYFLYVRDGQVTQVRTINDQCPASQFQQHFPDLFRALVTAVQLKTAERR